MKLLSHLYAWYGKKTVWLFAGIILVLAVAGLIVNSATNEPDTIVEARLPTVAVGPAGSLSSSADVRLIGTVEAVSEAQVKTEASGRITSVNVQLGQRVGAGQVIATQENSAERAAVLQAEGAYDAAVAAAASSDVGLDEAENAIASSRQDAVATFRSTYTTGNGTVRNLIDEFFTNPESGSIPGLRIDGRGYTSYLNNERVALRTVLAEWQAESNSLSPSGDVEGALDDARTRTERIVAIVDAFTEILANAGNNRYTDAELAAYRERFTAARSSLNGSIASIERAETAIENAEEARRRAQIAGSGSRVSAADAQIKQALGSLRAAQANLAKTITRAPITGTVSSLSVKTGDFVGSFADVAEIVNESALEVTLFLGERDLAAVSEGDVVTVEGGYAGTITRIAPAVSGATGKTEVKVALDTTELQSGDTVVISLGAGDTAAAPADDAALFVPITAVKFTESEGVVFTVVDNTLVANQVTVGAVRGSTIEIVDGITRDTVIVLDARGRATGQAVEPVAN